MSFRAFIAIIVAAFFLSALQSGFFAVLPAPFSFINVPLIVIIMLVQKLRIESACVFAAAVGFFIDAVIPESAGQTTVVLLSAAAATTLLFTRLFTNTSFAAYAGLHGLIVAAVIGTALLAAWLGYPLAWSIPKSAGGAALAVVMQIAASFVAAVIANAGRKALGRVFFGFGRTST